MIKRRKNDRARAPDVSVAFDNDKRAPSRVRRALRELSTPNDPIRDKVAGVASELVSDVVVHTNSGGTAQAWDPKPDVPFRLEVSDSSSRNPTRRQPDDRGGRGLHI